MALAVIIAAFAGFLLLFMATVALVTLNWGEKTQGPVYSVLVVGTATMLAAVLVSLKRSSIESAFVTSIVLDTKEGAPAMVVLTQDNPSLTSRLSELVLLGRPSTNKDGKTVSTIQKPETESARFAFSSELLQYQILKLIRTLQRGGWKLGMELGASTASVHTPMKLSNVVDYPGNTFLDVVKANRFADSDRERSLWKTSSVPLPKGTNITLMHFASQPGTAERFLVRLEKPLFYQIDFVVEPIGSTGMGILPKGLTLPAEQAAVCQTYHLRVAMDATFDWITAGNRHTQEYKDWANWLYSELKARLTDD